MTINTNVKIVTIEIHVHTQEFLLYSQSNMLIHNVTPNQFHIPLLKKFKSNRSLIYDEEK